MGVRDLALSSAQLAKAQDKEGWLALFGPDSFIQDPVGPYRWDPEGKGFHGRSAMAHFWDNAIAPNRDIDFEVHREFLCGDELARVVTIHIVTSDGLKVASPAVVCYKENGDGKLASVRAFWEDAQITPE
jgi:steroid Delta-isomerase